MEGNCSKCGAPREQAWKFCPECGAAAAVEHVKHMAPPEHEKSSTRGAYTGLIFGIVTAPILIIPGAMMCLTGLGAFLGVPLIVVGICMPLIGPMMGLGAHRGKCPWCGALVSSLGHPKEMGCHACSQRIAIDHGTFVKAV